MLVGVAVDQPARREHEHRDVAAHLHRWVEYGVVVHDVGHDRLGAERGRDRVGDQAGVVAGALDRRTQVIGRSSGIPHAFHPAPSGDQVSRTRPGWDPTHGSYSPDARVLGMPWWAYRHADDGCHTRLRGHPSITCPSPTTPAASTSASCRSKRALGPRPCRTAGRLLGREIRGMTSPVTHTPEEAGPPAIPMPTQQSWRHFARYSPRAAKPRCVHSSAERTRRTLTRRAHWRCLWARQPQQAHSPGEYVPLDELKTAMADVRGAVRLLLGRTC